MGPWLVMEFLMYLYPRFALMSEVGFDGVV